MGAGATEAKDIVLVRRPPRQRSKEAGRNFSRSTVTMTSSSSDRKSSLRSRSLVVERTRPCKIAAECENLAPLLGSQHARALPFAASQFGLGRLEFAKACFPFALQAARDQPISGSTAR